MDGVKDWIERIVLDPQYFWLFSLIKTARNGLLLHRTSSLFCKPYY